MIPAPPPYDPDLNLITYREAKPRRASGAGMTGAPSVTVKINADTTEFVREMRKAKREIARLNRAMMLARFTPKTAALLTTITAVYSAGLLYVGAHL